MSFQPSARAQVIARRTYARPLDEAGTVFETWTQTVDRVIMHQRWLWERARNERPLDRAQLDELQALRALMLERKSVVSGRTLWLGGTDIAKKRESSQFNCSFLRVVTIHDVVDAFWLLLQGCGVGFEPVPGTLNGFTKPAEIEVIRSQRHLLVEQRGRENNRETLVDGVYTIQIGDSAEAWAKAAGKIMAQKAPFSKIVLDFSQIRPAGYRLRGYGWISSGDATLHRALVAICEIMNRRAGQLLDRIDILDVVNWLGTTLSSRRSAEIALVPYGDPQWREFAGAKKDYWVDQPQRGQSNNSLLLYSRPSKHDIVDLLQMMVAAGGSEPGFINAEQALARAPWFKGVNPCAEILLGDRSFCNLVETCLPKFNGDFEGLKAAMRLIARANYRQTCVNLIDGVLQSTWHELNQFLRLCGVGVTGITAWEHRQDHRRWQQLRAAAQDGCHSMADELGLPRAKAVTTVKPSGTLSKIMDCPEGQHTPLGEYIINNVRFSHHDPVLEPLRAAGYRVWQDPTSPDAMLVSFPVQWTGVDFDRDSAGKAVNYETAVAQLDRYRLLMDNYVDYNASATISYSVDEVPAIANWVHRNWDHFVGVSFLFRNDPSKTAKDLGYLYLPQEVVDEATYLEYAGQIKPFDLDATPKFTKAKGGGVDQTQMTADAGDECAGGVCPVR